MMGKGCGKCRQTPLSGLVGAAKDRKTEGDVNSRRDYWQKELRRGGLFSKR